MRYFLIIFIALLAVGAGFVGATQLFTAPTVSSPKEAPTPFALIYPTIITGKVIALSDGDTVTVLIESDKQFRIRLAGIDAPETKQDFGTKSKENLASLVFEKEVTVHASKLDKYGRTVGQIFLGDQDICLRQIKDGMAWHYAKYQDEQSETDRKLYADAEVKARKTKFGLWQQPNPIAPWLFRHPELTNE